MKKIDLENYARRPLLEAFQDREVPFLSVTVTVDITEFKHWVDQHQLRFFIPISFLIAKAVNAIPELRHRLIKGELFECERVDPGYTVLLPDRTFSFCDSHYFEDFETYRLHAEARIRSVQVHPDWSTHEKHSLFFITNLPWFTFTSITHPYSKGYSSIPIISIGKYFHNNGRLSIPIAIQVHHALVDGFHLGEFYEHLTFLCAHPQEVLRFSPPDLQPAT